MHIEVAVLLPPFGFRVPAGVAAVAGPSRSWSDRARVLVDVGDGEVTLGTALDRAADLLGIHPELPFERTSQAIAGVSFYRDDVSEGRSKGRFFYPIVGRDGAVVWNRPVTKVSIVELIRTAEAGVLHGDPRRVYLVPQVAAGSGGEIDWSGVIDAIQWVVIVLQGLDGVLGGAERIRNGGRRMLGMLRRNSDRWVTRGGGLGDVVELADQDWSPDQLSILLDTPASDVEILLGWLGRVEQPDGAWEPGITPDDLAARAYAWAVQWIVYFGLFLLDDGHRKAAHALAEVARRLPLAPEITEEDVRSIILKEVNPLFEAQAE